MLPGQHHVTDMNFDRVVTEINLNLTGNKGKLKPKTKPKLPLVNSLRSKRFRGANRVFGVLPARKMGREQK